MKKNNVKGFTLVELLAVIVILAIILVIAVPKVMSVIEDSKKATLESTAKMIASSAEKQKVQNTVLGKSDAITCDSVAKINKLDYETCDIDFENNTAKVTIKGKGKFANLYVCNGTKTSAEASEESCTPVINAVSFKEDDWGTIVRAVQSGTYPYEVEDTKEVDLGKLGVHTLRVANTTSCSEEWMQDEEKSQTACGFVLEFADIITTHEMNGYIVNYEEYTNVGGWPASAMRTYVNEEIYNAIPEALRNGIIDTKVISSHGSSDKGTIGENKNFGSTDKIYLLSPQEIYGTSFTNQYDTSNGTSRQLDYYEDNNVTTSSYSLAIKNDSSGSGDKWWLRSAYSSSSNYYYNVKSDGDWTGNNSHINSNGVAPAFRIG